MGDAFVVPGPYPTPQSGDSAELFTVLQCVSTQWERGDRHGAVATLAEAVSIAEGEGRSERAATLALGVAKLALAARNAGSGERPAVRPAASGVVAAPPAREAALTAGAPRKSTVSGERPAITAKLGAPAKLVTEPPVTASSDAKSDDDPFLFNGWSDSELPAERAEVVTAKVAPEVVAAARARMKQSTADAFRPVALPMQTPTFRPPTIDLGAIEPFAELPLDIRQELAASAEMHVLGDAQEMSAFALVLVLNGTVDAISEHEGFTPERYGAGAVVSQQRLRAVAGSASVAIWRSSALDAVLAAFPSVRAKLSAA